MNPKVTVVIPVYNAVGVIDKCIDSLLKQTLPREAFEVLLVDDGSTDDSPAMLDALAAEHPHFRVMHIDNSGWAGRPRNIGVENAAGEYVQFLDQDDHLGHDALRRLYAQARRSNADVVLGKVASNFRGVPHGVFRADRDQCTMLDTPLYESLTPHKMFRTAFLLGNGIEHPEGRFLEDQPFMMEAYLRAERIAVVGTYVCYYYWAREDGNHTAATPLVPEPYAAVLRQTLDTVVQHTEPGALRDQALRRFYRIEILRCLGGSGGYSCPAEDLPDLWRLLRPMALEYMGEGVREGLGPPLRIMSDRLLADDFDGFQRAARAGFGVKAAARLEAAGWEGDGRFRVDVTVRLVHGEDRAPLELEQRGGRSFLPAALTAAATEEPVDVTDDLAETTAELTIRGRSNSIEWQCPSALTAAIEPVEDGRVEIVLRGSAYAVTEADGARDRLSKGLWDLWIPVRAFGQVVKARLGADRAEIDADCRPAVLGGPARIVRPYFTDPHGNLSFDVGAGPKKLVAALEDRAVELAAEDPCELRLDLFTTAEAKAHKAGLVLTGPAGVKKSPVGWRYTAERVHLQLPKRLKDFAPGVYSLGVVFDGSSGPAVSLGKAEVGSGGRLVVEGGFREAAPEIKDAVASRRREERRHRSLPRRVMRKLLGKAKR
jgi:glycosyltransferase involved in cell wall biosynthesis